MIKCLLTELGRAGHRFARSVRHDLGSQTFSRPALPLSH